MCQILRPSTYPCLSHHEQTVPRLLAFAWCRYRWQPGAMQKDYSAQEVLERTTLLFWMEDYYSLICMPYNDAHWVNWSWKDRKDSFFLIMPLLVIENTSSTTLLFSYFFILVFLIFTWALEVLCSRFSNLSQLVKYMSVHGFTLKFEIRLLLPHTAEMGPPDIVWVSFTEHQTSSLGNEGTWQPKELGPWRALPLKCDGFAPCSLCQMLDPLGDHKRDKSLAQGTLGPER